MAFIAQDPNLEEEDKKEQGSNPPPMLSGASSVINVDAFPSLQGASSSGAPARSTSSGRFVNLQSYLEQNRDQARGLQDKVQGQVENRAGQFESRLNEKRDIFNQQVESQRRSLNQDLLNEATTAPEQFIKDQNKMAQFSQMRDASYQGPRGLEDLEDYSSLLQDFNKAQEQVDNIKSESGRKALLAETFSNPGYSQGQKRLDQLFLQNDPGSRERFNALGERFSGLKGVLDQARGVAKDLASQVDKQNQQTRQAVRDAIGRIDDPTTPEDESLGALGQFQRDLANKTKDYREVEIPRLQALAQGLQNRQLSQEFLDILGIPEGTRTYNLNMANLAPSIPDQNQITPQNVASKEDYARYAALNALIGSSGSLLPSQPVGEQLRRPEEMSFDALRAALSEQDQAYNRAYQEGRGAAWDQSLMWGPNVTNDDWFLQPQTIGWQGPVYTGSVANATPKELEEFYIPYMNLRASVTNLPWEREFQNRLTQMLENWKNSQGFNNVIKKA